MEIGNRKTIAFGWYDIGNSSELNYDKHFYIHLFKKYIHLGKIKIYV